MNLLQGRLRARSSGEEHTRLLRRKKRQFLCARTALFSYGDVKLAGGSLRSQWDRIWASYLRLDKDRLLKVYRQQAGRVQMSTASTGLTFEVLRSPAPLRFVPFYRIQVEVDRHYLRSLHLMSSGDLCASGGLFDVAPDRHRDGY